MQYSKTKLITIITSTVFSFTSSCIAFYLMGENYIYWYLLAALGFFLPYAFIVSEYTAKYPQHKGGLYSWIRESCSERFSFLTSFIWYAGYVIWMVSLFSKMIIPITYILFGPDAHLNPLIIQFMQKYTLIIALIFLIISTILTLKGINRILNLNFISGVLLYCLSFLAITAMLILLFKNHHSPIIEIQPTSTIKILSLDSFSLFTFAITAFGGLDTIASLVEKIKNKYKVFSKMLILSSFIIVGLYIIIITLWNTILDQQAIRSLEYVHLGNIMYVLVDNLSTTFAYNLQFSPFISNLINQFAIRFTGVVMLISYVSLLSLIGYTPLKNLIEGTPKKFWSKKILKKNKYDVAQNAIIVQSFILAILLILANNKTQNLNTIYNTLSLMTNISRSLPYLILAFVFWRNFASKEKLYFFKNSILAKFSDFSVVLLIGITILITCVAPIIQKSYWEAFLLIIGPLCFALLGNICYNFYIQRKGN